MLCVFAFFNGFHCQDFDYDFEDAPISEDDVVVQRSAIECGMFIICPVGGLAELEEKKFDAREKTHFRLFTRKNPEEPLLLKLGDHDGLKKSHFDITKPTRVLIHGFRNQNKSPINKKLRVAYLKNSDVNVIVASWGFGSQSLCYNWAVRRTKRVGDIVGEFLDFALGSNEKAWKSLTIIGHSLGAHISGFAAKAVTKGRVAAIVGLDPGKKNSIVWL